MEGRPVNPAQKGAQEKLTLGILLRRSKRDL